MCCYKDKTERPDKSWKACCYLRNCSCIKFIWWYDSVRIFIGELPTVSTAYTHSISKWFNFFFFPSRFCYGLVYITNFDISNAEYWNPVQSEYYLKMQRRSALRLAAASSGWDPVLLDVLSCAHVGATCGAVCVGSEQPGRLGDARLIFFWYNYWLMQV